MLRSGIEHDDCTDEQFKEFYKKLTDDAYRLRLYERLADELFKLHQEGVLEIRKLGHDQLRQLCIDMGWCNHVDNDRYNELLEYADKADITSADILYIAQRIDEFTADNDYNGHVDSICCEIARRCWPMFTIREPNDE